MPETEVYKYLLRYTPSEGLVLDAGCGELTYTILLKYSKHRLEIIPIDIVIPDTCKKRNKYNFIQASAEKLPFREELFDFIFCLSTLQLIKDDRAVLKEFHRVLKTNGLLFLTIPTGKSMFRLIRDMEIRCGVYMFPEYNVPHYHYYTRDTIFGLTAGLFEIIDLYGYCYNFIPRLYSFFTSLAKMHFRRGYTRSKNKKNRINIIKHLKVSDKKGNYSSIVDKLKRIFSDLSYHYIVVLKKM